MDQDHDTTQTARPETGAPAPVSSFSATPESLARARLQPPDSLRSLGKLDDYEVLELIGAGGMGCVFRARHAGSGKEVAIKLLRPELVFDPVAVRRFLREARHTKQLEHPNILRIHETLSRVEGPYLVMDLVPSGSLAHRLNDGQPLSRDQVLSIARQVAGALAHAHAQGIIHRDLKPGNLLIDAQDHAYLTDFGLARTLVNDSVTDMADGAILGTAPYLSPGVARGLSEDTRCDIYAFGALLYEMLTGRPPYSGETLAEVRNRILSGPPPTIRSLNPTADRGLMVIAEAAMARELRDRYASMEDVVADLEFVAAGRNPEFAERRCESTPRQWLGRLPRITCAWVRRSVPALLGAAWSSVAGWHRVITRRGPGAGLSLDREFHVPGLWELDHARVVCWQEENRAILLAAQDNRVFRLSLAGEVLHSFPLPDPLAVSARLCLVDPNKSDGDLETAIAWVSGNILRGSLFTLDGTQRQRFELAGLPDPMDSQTTRSRLTFETRTPLMPGGPEQLLGRVDTPGAPAPRGVVSFDIATGNLSWLAPVASPIVGLATLDLDGDGGVQVVVGTAAVANGHTLPDGSHDGQAEILALGADGKVRWRWNAGDQHVAARPVIVHRGAHRPVDLWAWITASPDTRALGGLSEVGRVVHLAPDGALLRTRDFEHQLLSCLAVDLDGDGVFEVLVSDRFGYVYVLDAELEVRQRVRLLEPQHGCASVLLRAVADLDGDGRPEIVVDLADGIPVNPGSSRRSEPAPMVFKAPRLLVLDAKLQVRGRHSLPNVEYTERHPPRAAVCRIDADSSLEIVYCWQDKVRVYRLK